MPELPEVEYTARQLRETILGAKIREVLVFWERTIGHPDLPDFLAEVADRDIFGVRRRGKFLILDLSGERILTIHRRMTGNLLLLPPGWEIDTSLKTSDPVAWNIKGPFIQTPVWADLSRPSPIYRPSLDIRYQDEKVKQHAIAPSDLLYCRVCYNLVRVYHQQGKPCLRCGTPIERIVVTQRSTHFCPKCQKLTLE